MSKFNARKVDIDGHHFDSAAEGRRYATLAALERAGKIAGLELQPRFDCVVAGVKICSYVADFRYLREGAAIVEDVIAAAFGWRSLGRVEGRTQAQLEIADADRKAADALRHRVDAARQQLRDHGDPDRGYRD